MLVVVMSYYLLLRPGRAACKYCHEYVHLSVCPLEYHENHTAETSPNFFSDGVAMRFVLPVLWMTSRFAHNDPWRVVRISQATAME